MTDDATNPDDLPNGSGEGDTSSTGGDTSSGGPPEQPDSTQPQTSDGIPSKAGVEPPD